MHAAGDGRLMAVQGYVPGLALLAYERRWLRSDLVAGIVLAAILVPQGMRRRARRAASGERSLHRSPASSATP